MKLITVFSILFTLAAHSANFDKEIKWVSNSVMTQQDFDNSGCLTYKHAEVDQTSGLVFNLTNKLQGTCKMFVHPDPATVEFKLIKKGSKCSPAVYSGRLKYKSGIVPTKPVQVSLMDYRGMQCRIRIPGPMMMIIKQGGTSTKYLPVIK